MVPVGIDNILNLAFNVRGQARLIVRRRMAEHVLVVGSTNTARYGMVVSILASLSVNAPPAEQRFKY